MSRPLYREDEKVRMGAMKTFPGDVGNTPPERSALMARIRGKDTAPELAVRRWLHAAGYRFRLHRADLPGRPDVVLPRFKLALFIHGCFWHKHPGCKRATIPKTRTEFWEEKLARNAERDSRNQAALARCGWQVDVVWECEIRTTEGLGRRLHEILNAAQTEERHSGKPASPPHRNKRGSP